MNNQPKPLRLSDEQVAEWAHMNYVLGVHPDDWQRTLLAREVQHYRTVEAKLRTLHDYRYSSVIGGHKCLACGSWPWPCPTMRILDGDQ